MIIKKTVLFLKIFSALFVCLFFNLHAQKEDSNDKILSSEISKSNSFYRYWHDKGAEICRYNLEQYHYGETHKGEVFLIFVTELFNTKKQVKSDDHHPSHNITEILKINQIRRFQTGIYDYSAMLSVFKPIALTTFTNALKITLSIQEWCGQTFYQLNHTTDKKENKNGYKLKGFSYFESAGDDSIELDNALLEDELLLTIRINPKSLPLSSTDNPTKIIPSLLYYRLNHQKPQIEYPKISQKPIIYKYKRHKHDAILYTMIYEDIKRELQIVYEKDFPHRIFSWQEIDHNGNLKSKKKTTKATLENIIFSDYWNKNKNRDKKLRKKLY